MTGSEFRKSGRSCLGRICRSDMERDGANAGRRERFGTRGSASLPSDEGGRSYLMAARGMRCGGAAGSGVPALPGYGADFRCEAVLSGCEAVYAVAKAGKFPASYRIKSSVYRLLPPVTASYRITFFLATKRDKNSPQRRRDAESQVEERVKIGCSLTTIANDMQSPVTFFAFSTQ